MKGVSTFYFKRKDGTLNWSYRIELASVDGKRKQKSQSGYKTKAAAEKAGTKMLLQYEAVGQLVSPSDMSFADFLNLWIEKDCRLDLKPETIKGYQKKIKNIINPALGSYRLRSIKRDNLQAFLKDVFNSGYSINTQSGVRGILTKSLSWAVDNHYLTYSPAVRLKLPKNTAPQIATRKSERLYIPKSSMDIIFERFPETSPSHIPLKLGYECGMRLGEVFGLTWGDIDLDNQTITVNRQVQWQEDDTRTTLDKVTANGSNECGDGYWFFTNPKYNSFRVIDISNDLTALLRREKSRQEQMSQYYGQAYNHYFSEYPLEFNGKDNTPNSIPNKISNNGINPINFVLIRPDGSYISSRTMQHATRVIKTIIPEKFKFHDLRHTHISILFENNINFTYIQDRTGHKDLQTAVDYIRISNIVKEEGKAATMAIFNTQNKDEN